MTKLLGFLVAALGFIASLFGYKYQKAKRDQAEDRAESAEEGLQNATTKQAIDYAVRGSGNAERDKLRDKWTRKN